MYFKTRLLSFALLWITAHICDARSVSAAASQTTIACAVTTPNGIVAVGEQHDPNSYGTQQLSVGLSPDGTVLFKPGGAGFVTHNGSLGMKFGWQRGVRGQLTVEGRRLDAPAPPLRAEVLQGYRDFGLQPTYLIFSTPGCWEITGHVGEASVTFVTKVIKVGEGPAWRRDLP